MTWTLFWDMHTHGYAKMKQEKIYIEAPEEVARVIFFNRFGINPNRVSCTCCGPDYSVFTDDISLEKATEFFREEGAIPLDEYIKQDDVCVIYDTDIKDEERVGSIPVQGYIFH